MMLERARKVVDAMKEAFDIFDKMELPTEEKKCTLEHDSVIAIINSFAELESAATKWISAETPPQKLHDEEGHLINYLVYMPEYGVDVACCLPIGNTWVLFGLPVNVTHWAELPEPPKG